MSGHIYITGQGADPGAGRILSDPIFKPIPTLGACMPNIRRQVQTGDWIFVVSGRSHLVPQYIIGGLQVEDKISALEAYSRFPDYRLAVDAAGIVHGNIPVDASGKKHPLDTHAEDGFERRAVNYIVGNDSVVFETSKEVELAREGTLSILGEIKEKKGNRVVDIIGRYSKVDGSQTDRILTWMRAIKATRP